MTALSVQQLRFAYGQTLILDIPELQIELGEKVFLAGPSGSGKSTLLNLIVGMLDAPKGSVSVLGQDLSSLSGRGRDAFRGSHLGYIFQQFNLLPYLNAIENVLLPLRLSKARRKRVNNEQQSAETLLHSMRIPKALFDAPVSQLSVGQQQRVAAARALIGSPELIIADEPTSALDADHQHAFLQSLFEQCDQFGASLIFVSHDHGFKNRFDRTVRMQDINQVEVAHVLD